MDLDENYTETKTFWAGDFRYAENDSRFNYQVKALRVEETAHGVLYVEEANRDKVTDAKSIADEFEKNIYPKITGTFGLPENTGKKVTLLLMDIRDGYNGTSEKAYTQGVFIPKDLLEGTFSNRMAILYIDINPTKPGRECYTTIAHEFQHLINYSKNLGAVDTWLDEGLSTAAEHVYAGRQDSRVAWIGNSSNRSVMYGNNFYIWNGDWESSTAQLPDGTRISPDELTNYSTVYLFFQWLRIQAASGNTVYTDIINSGKDYRAVTAAAAKRIDPKFSNWDSLLQAWLGANMLKGSSGLYGYNGEFSPNFRHLNGSTLDNNMIALAPGEGVYSALEDDIDTADLPEASNIAYAGLDGGSKNLVPGDAGSFKGGSTLLTYNKDTSQNPSAIREGYVASKGSGGLEEIDAGRSVYSAVPELWQWDGAAYFRGKTRPSVPSRYR